MKYFLTMLIALSALLVYVNRDNLVDSVAVAKDKDREMDKERKMAAETKLFQVSDIKMVLLKSNPPQLEVTVYGDTTTSGWKNVRLNPFVYVITPMDGIYEFDFVAVPPEGPAAQVITPVEASYTILSVPNELKGIRVYALSNQMEKLLSDSDQYAGSDSGG
ncbi:hypothetical protein KCN56_02365 [Photobacterium galatheae]|uniref:hypothetical protein n=1 Tax=Photobacterium galatheae TaxID=1654360 RepID=UPI00202D0149|nr:hypothetical protein [Photobacterium galatheae]MCM0147412.1 hypothetical protein [Photobacterium galatheae]